MLVVKFKLILVQRLMDYRDPVTFLFIGLESGVIIFVAIDLIAALLFGQVTGSIRHIQRGLSICIVRGCV